MNKKTMWTVIGVMATVAAIGFGADWYINPDKPSIAGFVFSLLGVILSFVQFFAAKTNSAEIFGANLPSKEPNNNGKGGSKPMTGKTNHSVPPGDLSWFTRDFLKELDFDACHPRHIENTAKEIGAEIRLNATHDEMLDSFVKYVTNAADVVPLLLFADRVWYFEPRKSRTKAWDTFTKKICRAYQGNRDFRNLVESRTHLSSDFPIKDLLDCR